MAEAFKALAGGNVTVAPGRYWLGEPWRAFSYAEWDALLAGCKYFGRGPLGRLGEVEVVVFETERRDSTFVCEAGVVSAGGGALGLVTVRKGRVPKGMLAVDMRQGAVCRADGAVLRFGHLSIDTDPPPEGEPTEPQPAA